MLTQEQLRANAQQMLEAAKILLAADRCLDVAAYLSGYATEFQLKARIVEHQNLAGFPEGPEFDSMGLRHLKTHELHRLLLLSGRADIITADHMVEWSICEKWSPQSRYQAPGTVARPAAESIVKNVEELLKHL